MKKICILMVCCILLCCGCKADDEYNKLKEEYDVLSSDIISCEEQLENLNTKYDKLEEKNSSLKKELKEYKNKYKDIEDATVYLAELQSEIEKLENDKENKRAEIEQLESELLTIKDKIKNNKNEPISFYAGEYICGTDFPEGRYMIYDGDSNFFVSGGDTRVNIILGDDPSWGQVNEYIHFFTKGEKIEARSSFKLKLIE